MEMDMATSVKIRNTLHDTYSDVFAGSGCFQGKLSLQVKEDIKPYNGTT